MKIIYLDGNAGISGNMFLGALLDLGMPWEYLEENLNRLAVELPRLTLSTVKRKGIGAKLFEVELTEEPHHEEDQHGHKHDHGHDHKPEHKHQHTAHHHHRNLAEIVELIEQAKLPQRAKEKAIYCFRILAEAEAAIHQVTTAEIHFHEVGALDAIVDIVGTCLGLDYFGIDQLMISALRVGFGTVNCAHGEIPLPAPATVRLLEGYEVFGGDYAGEWTTPTGAALIRAFHAKQAPIPMMRVLKTGYGAGSKERQIANTCRLILGEIAENLEKPQMMLIESNIDDMNSEIYGYLGNLLLENGAKDYYYTPVIMKKGRPGIVVSVIVEAALVEIIEKILLTETTTFGVRRYQVERTCLERDEFQVQLEDHNIRVKIAYLAGEILKYAPEYEDCLLIARVLKQPLREVYEKVGVLIRKKLENGGIS